MRLLAILMCLMLTGCTLSKPPINSTQGKVPTLPKPDRPKLQKLTADDVAEYRKLPQTVQEKIEGNNAALQEYAQELEIAVTKYNGYAELTNQKSDAAIGVKAEVVDPKAGGK